MLSTTSDAPISAGATERKVREAAEDLADDQHRLSSIDHRLAVINDQLTAIDGRFAAMETRISAIEARSAVEGKLNVVISAVGINGVATMAILGVLLHRP